MLVLNEVACGMCPGNTTPRLACRKGEHLLHIVVFISCPIPHIIQSVLKYVCMNINTYMHTHMWMYIFMYLYHSERNNYIETKTAKTLINEISK